VKPQKGMQFNTITNTWEGNENVLNAFDNASVDRKKTSTPNANASVSPSRRNNTTPRPALIAPLSHNTGIQTTAPMVFDPVAMKWLKVPKSQVRVRHDISASVTSGSFTSGAHANTAMSITTATEDDEDDPFAGIPDIAEDRQIEAGAGSRKKSTKRNSLDSGDSSDEDADEEQLIREHFDVGPEFARLQTVRVAKIQKKLQNWPDSHFVPLTAQDSIRESQDFMQLLFQMQA